MKKIIQFLKQDIWRIKLKTLPSKRAFFIKQLRVILLALRGFAEDKCKLRASALTFYSLLSIVPVVAMIFGIAKGFGLQNLLEKQLRAKFPAQPEVVEKIISFAQSWLQNTQGGLIAGIGVVILFWTVMKVLGNIEKSFNDIWGVKRGRSIIRKSSDYLSVILLCPVLIIMSSSLTVFLVSKIELITQKIDLLGAVSPLISAVVKLLPYCLIWILFSFIYLFMPNTKVRFKYGLAAGILGGTIYQLVQWGYINFQVGVSKYNAIYGSFAALPLFLVWLQISWLIVLFGAEISFALQNIDTYEFEPDCLQVSFSFKKMLSLCIVRLSVKSFSKGKAPMTAFEIAHVLDVPVRLIRQVLFDLVQSRILCESKLDGSDQIGYQPAVDPDTLTIQKVLEALENKGSDDIPIAENEDISVIKTSLNKLKATLQNSPANQPLKHI